MRIENENIRELAPTGVRIPPNLKERIKLAAKEKSHSVNAEIIERLQESFISEELEKEKNAKILEKLDEVLKRLDAKA